MHSGTRTAHGSMPWTPIAVQQNLMRHSDIRTTMNIYGDVVTDQESQAHGKIVGLALPQA
jgi:integrase